jgi:multiple sugar transport system permease protein/putative aldouronate transport system permease protein
MALKPKKRRSPFFREMKMNGMLYAMTIPGFIILAMFSYIPFAGIWMAFTNFNAMDGIWGSPFVGLENFRFFTDGLMNANNMARIATQNTLIINAWTITLGLIFPPLIAICIYEIHGRLFKRITQATMFFPYFLSWIVVGAIVYALFSTEVGAINAGLRAMGLENVRWMAIPEYWKPILITSNVWKWSGYTSIFYLAAITQMDRSMFEAAEVDGANRIHRIIFLTIPMLKNMMVVLTLMSIGRIFYGDFEMVWGIIRGNPMLREATAIIDTYVYTSMLTLGFSFSTAIGLLQSIMGLTLLLIANKVAKIINDGEGLF